MKVETDDLERLRRRVERERAARREAESLLEAKSAELYRANQELSMLLQRQRVVFDKYRDAMVSLTGTLLTLDADCDANIRRLLSEGGSLLGACGGRLIWTGGERGLPVQLAGWRDEDAVSEPVWRRALGVSQVELREEGGLTYLAVPLDVRLRRQGVLVFVFDRSRTLDEMSKVVAELIASGIAGELERDDSRRALRLNEQRFKTLFHASVDAILILDHGGRIHEASDSAVRMFGLPRGWLLRTNVARIVAPESRQMARGGLRRARRDGRCHLEVELLRVDGTSFPAEVVGRSFEVDGERRIYGIFRDITVRRRHQIEAADREKKFRAVFQQSLDGIVLHGLDGRILDANEMLCRQLGWSREELLQMSVMDLHPAAAAEGCRVALQRVIGGGQHRYECIFQRRDGTVFGAEVSANRFELGPKSLVQGIIRDVTERQKAEEELRTAMKAAEAANEAKSVFLATMSHEIRTPLNGILGFAELLHSANLTGEERHSLQMLRKSGEVLLGLINNILDFSRAESGRIELRNEPLELREFLPSSVELIHGVAAGKPVALRTVISEELPGWILGSGKELRQIVMNLVGNALKFTDEGEVVVTAGPAEEGWFQLQVEDSGPGFPEGDAERLFEAFYQVDLSSMRRHGGTGLGLAICQRLVHEMGGRIWAENRSEGGARFVVELPLREPSIRCLEGEVADEGVAAVDGGGGRVLVVEDHPINARLATMLLEKLNFRTEVARDGREALERLAADADFVLVLMDMRMPVMDGLEATRLLRSGAAGDAAQGLPVVAVTANASDADRQECEAAGMDFYLSKPIERRALERVLTRVMVMRGCG